MDHRLACDTQAPLFWESEPPLTFAHMPPPNSSSARLSPSIWPSILVNAKLRAGFNNPDLPKMFLMPVTKKRSARAVSTAPSLFRNFRNIAFRRTQISLIFTAVPSHLRGGSRSSRTRGGMRWTRVALLTRALVRGRRSRVVLTPRRWRQVLRVAMSALAGWHAEIREAMVTTKPGHQGEREGNR